MLRIRPSGGGLFSRPWTSEGRPWTTFMDDFIVHRRLHWSRVVLLSVNTFTSSGVTLGRTCSIGFGRHLWTNRSLTNFLLPYQLLFISAANILGLTVILLLLYAYTNIYIYIWSCAQTSSNGILQRELGLTSLPSVENISPITQKGTHNVQLHLVPHHLCILHSCIPV